MNIKSILLTLALAVGMASGMAQDTGSPVVVYLNNGSVVTGTLMSTSNGKISIRTSDGSVLSYYTSEVNKIDNKQLPVPPTNQYSSPEGNFTDHGQALSGFYCSLESNTAVSIRPNKSNFGFEEIDLLGGYRFGYFLRTGAGFGVRYYFDNDKIRFHTTKLTMPLFVDLRGDFMSRAYRTIVPYWNLQIGTNLGDGFMIRPTIGMRIGERRSAFLLGLSYNGQSLKEFKYKTNNGGNKIRVPKNSFISFISLKIGYEF